VKIIADLCYGQERLFDQCNPQNDFPVLKGPYLGQKPPGMTPEIFAPGIVSTGLDELNSVFSPDNQEFYFCVRNQSMAVSIFRMKIENHIWSKPELLPFASGYGDIDVTLSPDGNILLFCSSRPISDGILPREDTDFWMARREGSDWGKAIYLGPDINSDSYDFYPMMTADGTIYFSSQREGPGTNNIYRSEFKDGRYTRAVKLSDAVNTQYREFDPYVFPDESLLIFTSTRPEGFGFGDLYICFKNGDGTWTQAKNMGEPINTPGPEYCAQLSPDHKYLFFTSARRTTRPANETPITYEDFQKYHYSPQNSYSDIYWIDAGIIETLR
jgi:hypothetical protein